MKPILFSVALLAPVLNALHLNTKIKQDEKPTDDTSVPTKNEDTNNNDPKEDKEKQNVFDASEHSETTEGLEQMKEAASSSSYGYGSQGANYNQD